MENCFKNLLVTSRKQANSSKDFQDKNTCPMGRTRVGHDAGLVWDAVLGLGGGSVRGEGLGEGAHDPRVGEDVTTTILG